jgi:hypothetical protein
MGPAVEKLEAALAITDLKTPRIPVISNVDAEPHSDPVTIKKILAQQVGVSALHTKSVEHFVVLKSPVGSPLLYRWSKISQYFLCISSKAGIGSQAGPDPL